MYEVKLKNISFIDTVQWLLEAKYKSKPAINPNRKRRKIPRVTKKRPKSYPRMTSSREIIILEKSDEIQLLAA